MRRVLICSLALGIVAITGCVGPMGPVGGVGGSIYTDVSGPVAATGNSGGAKMGQASSMGILGFAKGDSSIKTAAANGGITKISHVDYRITGFLSIYAKTVVTVYGD